MRVQIFRVAAFVMAAIGLVDRAEATEALYSFRPLRIEVRNLWVKSDQPWMHLSLKLGGHDLSWVGELHEDRTGEGADDSYVATYRLARLNTDTAEVLPMEVALQLETYRKQLLKIPSTRLLVGMDPSITSPGETETTFTQALGRQLRFERRFVLKRIGRTEVTLVIEVQKDFVPDGISDAAFEKWVADRNAITQEAIRLSNEARASAEARRRKSFEESREADRVSAAYEFDRKHPDLARKRVAQVEAMQNAERAVRERAAQEQDERVEQFIFGEVVRPDGPTAVAIAEARRAILTGPFASDEDLQQARIQNSHTLLRLRGAIVRAIQRAKQDSGVGRLACERLASAFREVQSELETLRVSKDAGPDARADFLRSETALSHDVSIRWISCW